MLDLGFRPSDSFWASMWPLISAGRAHPVISFCGVAPGVGTSTIAVCYASVVAGENPKGALLVDANLENPAVARLTGIAASPGLSEFLARDDQENRLPAKPTGIEKLDALPAGVWDRTHDHSGASILASPKWRTILEECRQRYGAVVIDAGAFLSSGNTLELTKQDAAIVVVCEWSRTRTEVLRAVTKRLKAHDAKVLGAVVNRRRDVIPNWVYRRL